MSEAQKQAEAFDVMDESEIQTHNGMAYEAVPAWDGKKIGIGTITAGEVLQWIEDKDGPRRKEAGLLLVARSLVKKDKTRMCPTKESQEAMVETLKGKDSKTINSVIERIVIINGIVKTPEQAKNVSGAES